MLRALAVVFLILFISSAQAGTSAEVAAQAKLVANLQILDTRLDAKIRELGNGRIGAAAAAGLASRIKMLADKIARMTELSGELAAENNDFDALRQQVASEPVLTLKDLAKQGAEDLEWKGTRNLLEMAVKKKAPNAKPLDSDAFEYFGKYAIREINEWTIRDRVRANEAHLVDVLRLIATLRQALNEDQRNLAFVEKLRQKQSANSAALERERAKLVQMQ